MDTSIVYRHTVMLCVVFFLWPKLALCGCILGSNSQDLIKRNNTILDTMNSTLMNYTRNSDEKIATYSNFQLWNHIQITLNVTADNYLVEGASMGRLLTINWLSATRGFKANWTENRTLEAYIRGEFLDPLHQKLQEMAVYYSFSLGIFRPRAMQFNFTGIDPQIQPPESPLNLNCMAGSRFVWRLSTNWNYSLAYTDRLNSSFARFATMVENSFDEYFRAHATLGKDFVRVNVLGSVESYNRVIVVLETYFVNSSFTESYITNLFKLDELPRMYFSNGTTKPALVTLNGVGFTYIVNSTVLVIETTTVRTTTSTIVTSTAITTTASSTNASTTTVSTVFTTPVTDSSVSVPDVSTSNQITNTSTLTTIELFTNTSTPTLPVMNVSNIADFKNTSAVYQPVEMVSMDITVPVELNLFETNTSTPPNGSVAQVSNASIITNAYGQIANTTTFDVLNITANINGSIMGNQSVTSYTIGTIFPNQSFTGYTNGTSFNNQSYAGNGNWTGLGNRSLIGYVNGIWFANHSYIGFGNWTGSGNQSYISYVSGIWFGNLTSIDNGNWSGFSNQTFIGHVNGTWFANQSYTGYGKWTGFDNQSYSGVVIGSWLVNQSFIRYGNLTGFDMKNFSVFGNWTTFFNQNSNGSGNGVETRTTFDPDPYFQPSVSVIKKVYNDHVLLWKISPMSPITAKMAFYTITIPVAVGIILVVILCLVCFQVECCSAGSKTNQSKDDIKLLT